MDITIIKTIAENSSTMVFLGIFIWFFLTKFNVTQEKMVDVLTSISNQIITMNERITQIEKDIISKYQK